MVKKYISILSLLLNQVGQLSVTVKRLVNHFGKGLPPVDALS